MVEKVRPIIAVAAAEANNVEQRQIIMGIIEQAKEFNADVAVISNIFNSNIPDDDTNFEENEIYNLILSKDIDGLVFISESFVRDKLKDKIKALFEERSDLPIIAVGTKLRELAELNLRYINTDGKSDIEDLTDHLIDEHGFTKIDMLTGFDFLEASHIRVNGYKASLEKHGIPYDESRVHYGTFWMPSGEELAMKYINGELPMPDAIVCANDYMAYGMLDTFVENDVPVPDAVTVVGYEYVWDRINYTPLLTTYQRNRTELGKNAVQLLFKMIKGESDPEFIPPRGQMILGQSCPCRTYTKQFLEELKNSREKYTHYEWNIASPMDKQLTNCSNIDELSSVMGENSFLVRSVWDMFLCLYEKWFDTESPEQNIISCRTVMPWFDNTPTLMHKYNIASIFARYQSPAAYFFTPLFFGENSFGYTVLKYDVPDTYDEIYKNWIKSVCNALEFIRMKNDIRYFRAYDKLSEHYDSMTGIYNEKGFENSVRFAADNSDSGDVIILLIKIITPDDSFDNLNKQISVYSEIADCLRMLYGDGGSICGRIERDLFGFAVCGDFDENYADLLKDKLELLVTYRSSCVKEWGLNSFITKTRRFAKDDFSYSESMAELKNELLSEEKHYAETKLITNYQKFTECRKKLHLMPIEDHTIEKMCLTLGFSEGHFRKLYRDYFGVSYHQDIVNCKIAYAKYLLCTSMIDTNSAATKCGFDDPKYFMRVFQKNTGYTVKQYREMVK